MSMSGSKKFFRAHGTELKEFFYRAQSNGYGNPTAPLANYNKDGKFSLSYEEGNWRYLDEWYGGEPFIGSSIIWHKDIVCWGMSYWGRIRPIPGLDYKMVNKFLNEALQHANPEHPWRGPTRYLDKDRGLLYRKAHDGGIRRFNGRETIEIARGGLDCHETDTGSELADPKKDTILLYEAFFRGGIVNKDFEVMVI